MNTKVLLVIIALIVVGLIALYLGGAFNSSLPAVSNAPTSNPQALPQVTAQDSTPDAIAASLLGPNSLDEITPVDSDPSLISSDDQAMNALDQSFNANQFIIQ